MPISRSILEQQSQPNVILAAGYEFLCDVLQRFLESDLPERETFLLARLGDASYRVERLDRISTYLSRQDSDQQYRELYRPLSDLDWLPTVWQVTDVNGQMADKEVADWKRRHEGQALVVVDGDAFVGLLYHPLTMRSGISKPLRELFPDGIGSHRAEMAEESFAPALELPKGLERELALAAPDAPLEMALPALEGEEAPGVALSVPFHTDIRFANWLKPGETRPLTVQLTKERAVASISDSTFTLDFQNEFSAETVQVHLQTTGFIERTGTWQKAIEVYSFQDSDKATFILTAVEEEGDRQISIDFRHKDRLIGNARFVVQVSSQPPATAGPAAADVLIFREPPPALEISKNPPPPPDVELRIRMDGRKLTFELHSYHQEVDASYAPMGGVELDSDPQIYMQGRFDELSKWASGGIVGPEALNAVKDRLTAIGNKLFLDLFPDKLKRNYWKLKELREQGVLTSLHITSDEPWIPWEIVKPFDADEDMSDLFLAQGWQVSRWLAGPGTSDKLTINEARLVAPDTNLSFVERERDFFAGLTARNVRVASPLRQVSEVRQIAKDGVELLHFSTHGSVDNKTIDNSAIVLQDKLELHPDDLLGEAVVGLRKRRPLIFLNTCHGARQGFSLSGLGGWASQLIKQAKAGIFIGALWEVNDALAAEFALRFYAELQNGETLGAAFSTARLHIHALDSANSTWLAYTLYGDPNMRVKWGV